MAFWRIDLPKIAVWDVEIFIGRNLSYIIRTRYLHNAASYDLMEDDRLRDSLQASAGTGVATDVPSARMIS